MDPLHGASRNSKRESVENLGEGSHGLGLEEERIISAIFYWQELSHVVLPYCRGSWEM